MNATEAKRRVLAVHPGAVCVYCDQGRFSAYAVFKDRYGNQADIGNGWTKDEAWIAAAAGLKEERNER